MIDRSAGTTERGVEEADQEAILSLMSDDYARRILDALGAQSLSARELIDRIDASRATVYRRLDKLEEAGIVESTMDIHPEGHHRKQFRVTVDRVNLAFEPDGVTIDVTT
ncbi:MAG: ArsR/SmtB family transcription factor [Halobacteriales archaeon]